MASKPKQRLRKSPKQGACCHYLPEAHCKRCQILENELNTERTSSGEESKEASQKMQKYSLRQRKERGITRSEEKDKKEVEQKPSFEITPSFESSKYTHHDMICRVLAGNGSMSVDNILCAMKEKYFRSGLHLHQRENVKNTLKQRQCFEETSPTRFCHRPALCKDFIRSVLSGQIVHRSDQRRKLNLDMYHIGISKLFRSSKHVCSMAHI